VLLDDNFSSIVEAVRQGRRIFDNLRNAVTFVVAVHVPIVGMSFLPVLFGWPLLLMPVHVMFLQLVIDPVCSVVFEAEREDEGTMRRPPRPSTASLFGARSVLIGILQGVALLAGVMAVQLLAWNQGLQPDSVRASAFLTLVLGILLLIFANRSPRGLRDTLRRANHAMWGIAIGASSLLGLVLALPTLRSPFHFGPVRSGDIVASIVAVLLCGLFFELVKRALHKRLD
jgi:P-type Ca2+ transporter type 2C